MKTQFRSVIMTSLVIIVCLVSSFLFVVMKNLYIEKWFNYIVALLLGLLTNAMLVFIISLINFLQLRKENARVIAVELNFLQTEFFILKELMLYFRGAAGQVAIPDSKLDIVDKCLERLDNISLRILHSEKISPLNCSFLEKPLRIRTNTTRVEDSFITCFKDVYQSCHIAYHTFRLAPYERNESNLNVIQTNLRDSIQNIINYSTAGSEFHAALDAYQKLLYKILKKTAPESVLGESS